MRQRYAVIFERAEGNWAVYVPDLPGCITTAGTLALGLRSPDFFPINARSTLRGGPGMPGPER